MAALIEGEVNRRLLHPGRVVSIEGLTKAWSFDVIEATLSGYGALHGARTLLNKVRGALGNALLAGASDRVRARKPCDWHPPCAAEVFFGRKPSIRIGTHASEIPKPFVLSCESVGQDLVVRMTVFGFARDWSGAVALALADALRNRVRWRRLAEDQAVFVPREVQIRRVRTAAGPSLDVPNIPASVRLNFLSALDAERGSAIGRPQIVLERLARRVSLLARWHDVALDVTWLQFEQALSRCEMAFLDDVPPSGYGRRGGHHIDNTVAEIPAIEISGDLDMLWPALVIGETSHIGRGASIGLGRYTVTAI